MGTSTLAVPRCSWLRDYAPILGAYLIAMLATGGHFHGDSIDYVADILRGDRAAMWEFGHLLWRPLGWLVGQATVPLLTALFGTDAREGLILTLYAINWLSGLGCVLLLRALVGRLGPTGWSAALVTIAFLISHAFLNFAHTGSAYVPGLFCLVLGAVLSTRPAASGWTALFAGIAFAGAVCLWFLYILALPAALLLPFILGDSDRRHVRVVLLTTLACALTGGLVYGTGMAIRGIRTPEQFTAWVQEAGHGVAHVKGVARMAFGFPRSFIFMDRDGVLFKRYLVKDPLNPVSAGDLVRASLWKLALFYLLLAAVAVTLFRSARGRRLLAMLAVAAVPILGFAIAWQGGDLERYLPFYPFLFLALAWAVAQPGRFLARSLALGFFVVVVIEDGRAMARPVLEHRRQELARRVAELREKWRPGSEAIIMRDEVEHYERDYPLDTGSRGYHLRLAAVPGLADSDRWRQAAATTILATWQKGGDVWVAKRLMRPTPDAAWTWVEGDDPNLAWADVHRFFDLEVGASIGGEDGFVLLAPSPANVAALREASRP